MTGGGRSSPAPDRVPRAVGRRARCACASPRTARGHDWRTTVELTQVERVRLPSAAGVAGQEARRRLHLRRSVLGGSYITTECVTAMTGSSRAGAEREPAVHAQPVNVPHLSAHESDEHATATPHPAGDRRLRRPQREPHRRADRRAAALGAAPPPVEPAGAPIIRSRWPRSTASRQSVLGFIPSAATDSIRRRRSSCGKSDVALVRAHYGPRL